MSKKRRSNTTQSSTVKTPNPYLHSSFRLFKATLWLLPGLLIGAVGTVAFQTIEPNPKDKLAVECEHDPTIDELVAMTNDELASIDPVIISLVVAKGIPSFADLRTQDYVQAVDAWAAQIRNDTNRHSYRFNQDPSAFNNSMADFKISWLASDINSLFQVDYDVLDFDFSDPSNLFLNGIVDRRRGTCVSMPMLYVAIGWRLGYPIKLVPVPTHIFARWDDGKERINIEATGYGASYTDSHYEQEFFVSQQCKQRGGELASLTPRETLAMLILARYSYWAAIGDSERRFKDALRANLLYPTNALAMATLDEVWRLRWTEDDYVRHAIEHLADAGDRIEKQLRLTADNPVERMITGVDGQPKRVIVDKKTSAFLPVND